MRFPTTEPWAANPSTVEDEDENEEEDDSD